MAAPTWTSVSAHGSSGNGYFTVSCNGGYKGRLQRMAYAPVTTSGESPVTVVANIIQLPVPEYIRFDDVAYRPDDTGGYVVITGKSNAEKLAFVVDGNFVELPQTFEARQGDDPIEDNAPIGGYVIAGDIGATEEYEFELQIAVSANDTKSQRTCRLTAIDSLNNVSSFVNIIQDAESYIDLSYGEDEHQQEVTVNFDNKGMTSGGRTADVLVFSNDNWSVSIQDEIGE